jgi:general secretion pathway protein M
MIKARIWRTSVARYQRWQAAVRATWESLGGRERRLLVVVATCGGLTLLWLGFIEPPLARITHWQSELPRLRSQQAALDSLLQPRPQHPPAELSRLLVEQLDHAALAGHYQLQPLAQGWQLRLDNAPAPDLLHWLLSDLSGLNLEVRELRLERQANPDEAQPQASLSGSVSVQQALHPKDYP